MIIILRKDEPLDLLYLEQNKVELVAVKMTNQHYWVAKNIQGKKDMIISEDVLQRMIKERTFIST